MTAMTRSSLRTIRVRFHAFVAGLAKAVRPKAYVCDRDHSPCVQEAADSLRAGSDAGGGAARSSSMNSDPLNDDSQSAWLECIKHKRRTLRCEGRPGSA